MLHQLGEVISGQLANEVLAPICQIDQYTAAIDRGRASSSQVLRRETVDELDSPVMRERQFVSQLLYRQCFGGLGLDGKQGLVVTGL